MYSRGCTRARSEEHTSELQSHHDLVCRLLLEKKKAQCVYSHHPPATMTASSTTCPSWPPGISTLFSFTDPAPTEIYTLSLHDALPISPPREAPHPRCTGTSRYRGRGARYRSAAKPRGSLRCTRGDAPARDRKSTRLNSSHITISYAVFCLKKKKPNAYTRTTRPRR